MLKAEITLRASSFTESHKSSNCKTQRKVTGQTLAHLQRGAPCALFPPPSTPQVAIGETSFPLDFPDLGEWKPLVMDNLHLIILEIPKPVTPVWQTPISSSQGWGLNPSWMGLSKRKSGNLSTFPLPALPSPLLQSACFSSSPPPECLGCHPLACSGN